MRRSAQHHTWCRLCSAQCSMSNACRLLTDLWSWDLEIYAVVSDGLWRNVIWRSLPQSSAVSLPCASQYFSHCLVESAWWRHNVGDVSESSVVSQWRSFIPRLRSMRKTSVRYWKLRLIVNIKLWPRILYMFEEFCVSRILIFDSW